PRLTHRCGFLFRERHNYIGAGDGNRTHVASLEGWSSTIELHPRYPLLADPPNRPSLRCPARQHRTGAGGGGRIRTYVGIRRQIYSLLPLTTRPPLRDSRAAHLAPSGGPRSAGHKSFTLVCQHAEAPFANTKPAL